MLFNDDLMMLPMSLYDGMHCITCDVDMLYDGCEGCDADTSRHEHGDLILAPVLCWRPVWPVDLQYVRRQRKNGAAVDYLLGVIVLMQRLGPVAHSFDVALEEWVFGGRCEREGVPFVLCHRW